MVGSDGEVLRTPFNDMAIPQHRWPSDFVHVLAHRRQMMAIEREIANYPDYPRPTERTKKSSKGMEGWRDWLRREREREMKRKEGDPPPEWKALFVPDYYAVYDHLTPGFIAYGNVLTGEVITRDAFRTNRMRASRTVSKTKRSQ